MISPDSVPAELEVTATSVGGSGSCGVMVYEGNNLAALQEEITWSSSDPSTISVSQTGAITAHKAGSALISAHEAGLTGSTWVVAY